MFSKFAFQGFGHTDTEEWEGWTPPWHHHGPQHHHHGEHHPFGPRPAFMHRRGPFGHGPFGHDPRQQGPFGHGPFGQGQGGRFFGRGDMKFALLALLRERPMYGYEMIKALEEKSSGFYSPSPGSIYPTLQMLEERGSVSSEEVEGKKVYSITESGRTLLDEHEKELSHTPWDRLRKARQEFEGFTQREDLRDIRKEMGETGRLFGEAARTAFKDPEKLSRLRKIVTNVRSELAQLLYGQPETPQTPKSESPSEETTGE